MVHGSVCAAGTTCISAVQVDGRLAGCACLPACLPRPLANGSARGHHDSGAVPAAREAPAASTASHGAQLVIASTAIGQRQVGSGMNLAALGRGRSPKQLTAPAVAARLANHVPESIHVRSHRAATCSTWLSLVFDSFPPERGALPVGIPWDARCEPAGQGLSPRV